MTHKTWRVSNRVAASAIASALSLLFGTAAHGAVYPARFDPGGNGSFIPGFTGNALFDIPFSCLEVDGWKPTSGSGGCGAADMLSAITYLYSTSPSDPPVPGIVLDQFTLGSFPVLGVLSAGGQPIGVDTDPMGPASGTSTYEGTDFWLQFVSGFCPTDICAPIPGGGDLLLSAKPSGDPAFLFVDFVDLEHRSEGAIVTFGPACRDDPPPTLTNCVVVTQAPEPGALSLVLAALGGAWLARRRKSRA